MASGETELNFRVQVQGLNQLGQLRSSVMKLSGGTKRLVDSSMALGNAFPKLEGAAKDLQKIYFGQAQTIKQLVRNQKIFKNTIKAETGFMRAARKETNFGSNAWRAYTAEIIRARKQMSSLPLRKLGTDLRNVADTMLRRGKDLQWIGRQMIVGISAPLGLMMRSALQSFEAFEKQFVRTRKILGLTEDAARGLSSTMLEISTKMGASRSIVAGLTSDFAQMGNKLLGSTRDLQDVAADYAELTLQLEHVGQVSAGVGRDFIANIAGLIKGSAEGAEKIAAVRGQLAKFNMVENITALALKDLAEAFPQVSPAAKAVGMELTFLAGVIGQMKELGLNATESAHALKFGLQRMINPTTKVKNLSAEYATTIKGFNEELGVGNALLFNLAENMQLIKKEAGSKEALIWLGELVGKRQASRIYALVSGMDSLEVSIGQIGKALDDATKGPGMDIFQNLGSQVTEGVETLDDLKAKFKEVFAEDDSVQQFVDQFKISQEMGDLESDMPVFIDLLKDLSPPLKALVIDYIGATAAGKVFAQELEIVMGGPAMMMQKTRNDVKNLLQEFGAAFYYTIQNIIPQIQDFLQWLQKLSPRTKFLIVVMGGLLAVLGPVAFIFGQLTNAFASVTKAAAFLLPKMKDFTRSLFLAKMLAGEKLPILRRLAGGMAVVGKSARKAGDDLDGYGTRAMRAMRALRQDPSIGGSGFFDMLKSQPHAGAVGGGVAGGAVKGGSKAVAAAMDAAMEGLDDVSQLSALAQADVLKAFDSVVDGNEQAATKSVGRLRGMFQKTNKQFDDMAANTGKRWGKLRQKLSDLNLQMKRISHAQVGKVGRGKIVQSRIPKGQPGAGQFGRALFAQPSQFAAAWKKKISAVTADIGDKFKASWGKVGRASKLESVKTKLHWKNVMGGLKKGIVGAGKGAFKLVKIHGILSAMAIGVAFKAAGVVMKLAMIGTGVGIFLVALGGIILFVKANLDKFKEAGKGAFTTLRIAFATLKEALLEVGNIFFSVFQDVFGGGGDEAADGAEDNMSAISGAMQGVADFALKMSLIFKKVVTFMAETLFPRLLGAAKVVFTAIGAALGWLGDNWKEIARIVFDVVYQIVRTLEYLVDVALGVIAALVVILRGLGLAFFGLLDILMPVLRVLASAFHTLLDQVVVPVVGGIIEMFFMMARRLKGIIEASIRGINGLIDALNKIPGISIGKIELDIGAELDKMENAAKAALEAFDSGKDAANDYIQNELPGVVRNIGGVVDDTFDKVQQGLGAAIEFGAADIVGGFLDGVLEGGHDLGEAAKLPVKDGVKDGAEEGAEEADLDDFGDSIEKATEEGLRRAVTTWVGKVKSAFQNLMSETIDLAMADFDAKSKIYLSAYDTRVEAIQKTIAAEKALTKTVQYENERRAIINRMALDKENFIRGRALALYEGRIEDARSLAVKFSMGSDKSTEKLGGLDSKRAADLLAETRRLAIEEINDAKAHHTELVAIDRKALAAQLDELKLHLPKSEEEWRTWVTKVDNLVTGSIGGLFGEEAANAKTIEEFARIADREVSSKFAHLFGASGVVDREVTKVGPTVQRETRKWTNTVFKFKTDSANIMKNLFREVEAQWIEDLQWDIIAHAWGEGRKTIMENILPLITDLETLKNGVQDLWDDIMEIFVPDPGESPESRRTGLGGGTTGPPSTFAEAFRQTGAGSTGTRSAGYFPQGMPPSVSQMSSQGVSAPSAPWYQAFHRDDDSMVDWVIIEAQNQVGAALTAVFNPDNWGGPASGGRYVPRDEGFGSLTEQQIFDAIGDVLARSGDEYHSGGLITGAKGQIRNIKALAGEYVINARAAQNIGISKLDNMNNSSGGYQGDGGAGTTIFVENFIGEPEWFESMMGDYNVNVAPKNERSRGLESRKISSMADNNRRGRV